MDKKEQIGICSVCGEQKKLTFEHYPPQAAFNKTTVLIKDSRHLTPLENKYLYGKSMKSRKGFGGYRLCKSCNNNTGDWYARDYSNLVQLAKDTIIEQRENSIINFSIGVKPLNFLKQVLVIHLCADQALGELREVIQPKEFILKKESQLLSKGVKIYMYATLSTTHRFMGISVSYSFLLNAAVNYSEFNFHPFGFLLALDSEPPLAEMMDITDFYNYEYDETVNIDFSLPLLNIKTIGVGTYP